MARTLNKADRMSEVQSLMDNTDIDTFVDAANTLAASMENIRDALQEASEGAGEALSYHEERAWESRDDALETANNAASALRDDHIPQAREALEALEGLADQLESIANATQDACDHLDHVMEV